MISDRPLTDSSLSLAVKGYAWLPDRRRREGGGTVRTRLMGRQAVALHGTDAVRFFYDERHVRRSGAIPGPVLSTLFGHGAVHTLDGARHRGRKDLFLSLLTGPGDVARLVAEVTADWDRAAAEWRSRPQVVLMDEAALLLTRAVCRWSGVPVAERDAPRLAADLVAMVDGFATAGPRHWRARAARRRREAWLGRLVTRVREGSLRVPEDTVLGRAAAHRDVDGVRLDPRVAAVEVLNVLRPTVALAYFVAFSAHALHRWPVHRERLRARGGEGAARAVAFAHEVRRFYPFAPFVGGLAADRLTWAGEEIPAGSLVLLDLYGLNHDPELYPRPYAFDPGRFAGRPPGRDELVPQGGGDRAEGHRCPGEDVTVAVLAALAPRLAALEYDVPEQDLSIPLRRIPARPRSGVVLAGVRGGDA